MFGNDFVSKRFIVKGLWWNDWSWCSIIIVFSYAKLFVACGIHTIRANTLYLCNNSVESFFSFFWNIQLIIFSALSTCQLGSCCASQLSVRPRASIRRWACRHSLVANARLKALDAISGKPQSNFEEAEV